MAGPFIHRGSFLAKCFERLILAQLKHSIRATLDEHQFTYRVNWSTEDAISIALHTALEHLECPYMYVRMPFLDFSSAFSAVIPNHIKSKLHEPGLNATICNWTKDFLTNCPQTVKLGKQTSSTLILNTGVPQGCVLSPILYAETTTGLTYNLKRGYVEELANCGIQSPNKQGASYYH